MTDLITAAAAHRASIAGTGTFITGHWGLSLDVADSHQCIRLAACNLTKQVMVAQMLTGTEWVELTSEQTRILQLALTTGTGTESPLMAPNQFGLRVVAELPGWAVRPTGQPKPCRAEQGHVLHQPK